MLTPRRLSSVYAANTAGAIAGALLAGFVFVPAFGLQTTLRIAALASVSIGAIVLFASKQRIVALATGAVVAAGVFTLASWDPALLSSGAYRFAPAFAAGSAVSARCRRARGDADRRRSAVLRRRLVGHGRGAAAGWDDVAGDRREARCVERRGHADAEAARASAAAASRGSRGARWCSGSAAASRPAPRSRIPSPRSTSSKSRPASSTRRITSDPRIATRSPIRARDCWWPTGDRICGSRRRPTTSSSRSRRIRGWRASRRCSRASS